MFKHGNKITANKKDIKNTTNEKSANIICKGKLAKFNADFVMGLATVPEPP